MTTLPLTLRSGDDAVHAGHRPEYLDQLVAPMDDMWMVFAEMAEHHALIADGDVVGSCALDGERRLLRFHVRPAFRDRSSEWLAAVVAQLDVARLMVSTVDPGFLSAALDAGPRVSAHSRFYRHALPPGRDALGPLHQPGPGEQPRIVDFQEAELGAPRAFLEGYAAERLERGEFFLHEAGGQILVVGELRRDPWQAGIAHLGLVVRGEARGQGLGTRMLNALVGRSLEEGLRPRCSTETGNLGARRAIERAGFLADHRLLEIVVGD